MLMRHLKQQKANQTIIGSLQSKWRNASFVKLEKISLKSMAITLSAILLLCTFGSLFIKMQNPQIDYLQTVNDRKLQAAEDAPNPNFVHGLRAGMHTGGSRSQPNALPAEPRPSRFHVDVIKDGEAQKIYHHRLQAGKTIGDLRCNVEKHYLIDRSKALFEITITGKKHGDTGNKRIMQDDEMLRTDFDYLVEIIEEVD